MNGENLGDPAADGKLGWGEIWPRQPHPRAGPGSLKFGWQTRWFPLIAPPVPWRSFRTMKKLITLFAAMVTMVAPAIALEAGYESIFDGKTLDGWKANENPGAFSIEDGAIKANGDRAHLFYVGKVGEGKFKNFEVRLDVMTRKNSNGGFFIHSKWLDAGWPSGYEIQVNNSQSDPQKSGSLYNTVKNLEAFEDDKWMKYEIKVKDGVVNVTVNNKKLVEDFKPGADTKLVADGGAFCIQAHDKGSTTLYKNIRVKILK